MSCHALQVAEDLRARVRTQLNITCSCGVAPNRMLAKVSSGGGGPCSLWFTFLGVS